MLPSSLKRKSDGYETVGTSLLYSVLYSIKSTRRGGMIYFHACSLPNLPSLPLMDYHCQFSLLPKSFLSLNKEQLWSKYLSIKLGVNTGISAYAYGKGSLNAYIYILRGEGEIRFWTVCVCTKQVIPKNLPTEGLKITVVCLSVH